MVSRKNQKLPFWEGRREKQRELDSTSRQGGRMEEQEMVEKKKTSRKGNLRLQSGGNLAKMGKERSGAKEKGSRRLMKGWGSKKNPAPSRRV